MGTEVLRPQDWLAERFQVSPPSFVHRRNGQHNHPNRKNSSNYGYRNQVVLQNKQPLQQELRNPNTFPSYDDFKVVSKHTQNNRNHMPKVSIMRRGESMDFLNEKIKKRISPKDMVPDTMYAGSAFSASPSPSDLPLPTFFKKHKSFDESFDDSATRDLRRLLRIE